MNKRSQISINIMNKNKIFNFLDILIYAILFLVLGQYIVKDFNGIKGSRPFFILRNINLSYDAKMEIMVGKTSYNYVIFLKENTPEDSTILIPPQGFPWPHTSNVGYFRYFLYPRKLVNGNEKDSKVDLKSVDFVLIDYGETKISQYGFTNVWPKFDVDGEYIIYWDPVSKKTWKADNSKYTYDKSDLVERWGIVKIKK